MIRGRGTLIFLNWNRKKAVFSFNLVCSYSDDEQQKRIQYLSQFPTCRQSSVGSVPERRETHASKVLNANIHQAPTHHLVFLLLFE